MRSRLVGFVGVALLIGVPAAAQEPTPSASVKTGTPIATVEVTTSWDALSGPAAAAVAPVAAGSVYEIAPMRQALQNLYALGAVADVQVEATGGPDGLAIRFIVIPQTLFWDVEFTGERPWSKRRLRETLAIREGSPLDADTAGEQARRLESALADGGYLLASVTPTVIEGTSPSRGVLRLAIVPGVRARLGGASVRGDEGISSADLTAALGLPTGSPYEPATFEAGLDRIRDRILASNYFFHEIRVVEQSLDLRDNSMWVEIEATMGPRVALDVSGVPFSPEQVRARLAIYEFGTVEDWALKDTRHELVRWLQERGHWRPLVSYTRRRDEEGRNVEVSIRVLAGQRAKLVDIGFRGNAHLDAAELAAAIRSEPAAFLAPRRFLTEWWEADQRAVVSLYRRNGFRRASISDESVRFDSDLGGVVATMTLDEGPQTMIDTLEVTISDALSPLKEDERRQLRSSLANAVGDPLNLSGIRRDTDRIRAFLANRGFPRAFVTTTILDEEGPIRVVHEVLPGVRQQVGDVLVAGNEATRDGVIERELAFTRGEPFSFSDQLETQSRLYATGLFSQVDVEPTVPDGLDAEQAMVVRVQEAPPLFVTYGAGFDTEEKVRGTFTIGHNNISGRNQELSFATRASLREQRFRVLFREPYFFGRRTEGTATAFYTNEQKTSFSIQRFGVSFQLLFQHGDHFASLPRLLFRDTSTFNVEIDPELIRPEDQSTRVGALAYSFIVDTRSDPIEPTDGLYGTVDAELASQMLGSNTNFATLVGRTFTYLDVSERFTVALGGRAGVKIPYGSSTSIPLPERFFAGGSTTLRGFRLDGAGPVDDNGNPLGGRVLLIANAELRARLWGSLGGVLFADIGNVFALPQSVRWNEVRETLGAGLRYATPVGPIRFDVARLMDRRQGEDEYQLFFSVGHTF